MTTHEPTTKLRQGAEVAELRARIASARTAKELKALDVLLFAAKARQLRGMVPAFPPLEVPRRCL